jgi:GNAT superfamily N-acetyltransferase
MEIVVRRAAAEDYTRWRELWDAYIAFAQSQLDESVTQHTWQRIVDGSSLRCLVAEADGAVCGFALAVLHEGSWVTHPVCYLEDLFVDQLMRGVGAGRALLEGLRAEGEKEGWAKIYWLTRAGNPARKLYDQLATVGDYVRYTMPL